MLTIMLSIRQTGRRIDKIALLCVNKPGVHSTRVFSSIVKRSSGNPSNRMISNQTFLDLGQGREKNFKPPTSFHLIIGSDSRTFPQIYFSERTLSKCKIFTEFFACSPLRREGVGENSPNGRAISLRRKERMNIEIHKYLKYINLHL